MALHDSLPSPTYTAALEPRPWVSSLPAPSPSSPLNRCVRHGSERHRRRRGLRCGKIDSDVRRHDGRRRAWDVEDGGDDLGLDVWIFFGALVFNWEALGVPFTVRF